MTDSSEATAPVPRKRGRPSEKTRTQLLAADIYAKGLELTRTMALQHVGMSSIARDLGVSGTLIHYLVGNLAQLHAGVTNQFNKRMCEAWPADTGDWRADVRAIARHIFRTYTQYPGVALFWGERSRPPVQVRILDEQPYGLLFMDKVYRAFVRLELDVRTTILFTETFMDLLLTQVRATVTTTSAADREELMSRFAELDAGTFEGLAFVRDQFFSVREPALMEDGLELLLEAFEISRNRVEGAD